MSEKKHEKEDVQSHPKSQSQQRQENAPDVSSRHAEKHTKDDSAGSEENTTKKQANSV